MIPHDVSRQVAKKKPSPSSWMLHIFVNSRAIIPFLVPNSIPIGFVPNDPIWRFPEIGVPLNYLIGLNNNCNVPTTEPVAHRQRSILRTQAQRFKPSSLKPHDCGRLIKLNQAIHAAALQESHSLLLFLVLLSLFLFFFGSMPQVQCIVFFLKLI